MNELELVKSFHAKYKIPIVDDTSQVPQARIDLRINLLNEEIRELSEADAANNISEIAKEAGDVYYVILGTALELAYWDFFQNKKAFANSSIQTTRVETLQQLTEAKDVFRNNPSKAHLADLLHIVEDYLCVMGLKTTFPQIFEEVHRSNMSKGTNGKPLIREDGKILKGEDFSPADLSFLNEK